MLALDTLLSGEIIPLYNDDILQEYDEVPHREKLHLPGSLVNAIIRQIKKDGITSDKIHTDETFPDPTDVVFYEVALSKADSFLVIGNIRHFPKNPIVVTPSGFLKLIGSFNQVMPSFVSVSFEVRKREISHVISWAIPL